MPLHLILLMFLLFLSGCAQQISDNSVLKSKWQRDLHAQTDWQTQGKLAFIHPEKRQSANYHWMTRQQHTQLNLTSFIGTSILSMEKNADAVNVTVEGKQYQDTNAQNLIYRLTGFNLPFVNDDNWLKGLPNTPDYEVDHQGRVIQAKLTDENAGTWLVNYQQYKKHQGYWLPYSITLQQHDLKLKLKIFTWQFN